MQELQTASGATRAKPLAFPLEEYKGRIANTQAEMKANGLDALVLHAPENLHYLSGLDLGMSGYFEYQALIVPTDSEPVLAIREVELPAADETSWVTQRVSYADTDAEPIAAVQRALSELGLERARIGLDTHSWFLTAGRHARLQRALPQGELVPEPQIVDHLRLVKSPREVEYLRKASRVVEAGIRAGIDAVAQGVSEYELAAAISAAQALAGTEGPLAGAIASGERTEQMHSSWTSRVVQPGDLVWYELSGIKAGYWARLMRSVVAGQPSYEQRHAEEVVRAAQDDAISRMAPGVSAAEIDDACRRPILESGLRESYHNRIGYSLGLIVRPSAGEFLREFVPGSDWRLEPGMVFHMLAKAKGVGFSETVLVTEDGHELLTQFPRELFGGLER